MSYTEIPGSEDELIYIHTLVEEIWKATSHDPYIFVLLSQIWDTVTELTDKLSEKEEQ